MSDELDLRRIDQRHEPDPEFRAALRRRVLDIAAGIDPSESSDPLDFVTLDVEPVSRLAGPTRRRPLIRAVVAVAAAAAVVVATVVVTSRDNRTNPSDTPISVVSSNPLEEPSPDEVERASDGATYMNGSGHTEVTPARNFVSLRCRPDPPVMGMCGGTEGWAYVTGGADSPEVQYGLLGVADYLTVSALDDRLFVASASPSTSQDPQPAPVAWLIDSVTGQRGELKWREQPVTLTSAQQDLVLFAAQPNPFYVDIDTFQRFLPRVVDRRDWTISPLNVPADATAALSIAQPGSGRIWIGTAPDGKLGLAYTDDGGSSWTDVELPRALDNTSEELLAADPAGHYPLLVAATGDHVAVTKVWTGFDDPHDVFVYVSADAGDQWTTVPIASAGLNGTEMFVLADRRLIVVLALDYHSETVLAAMSASDWSQLEEAAYEPPARSHVDVNHDGILVNYGANLHPATFTTDLRNWWTIPGLPSYTAG